MGVPKGTCNRLLHGGYMRLQGKKLDGRTTLSKALNQLMRELTADLGENPSRAQQLIIERVVFKSARLGFFEQGMLRGEVPDSANVPYIALANSLRLDLMALGLQRQEKKYVTLQGYLKKKKETSNV